MSYHIDNGHNKSLLLYHLVYPKKYRRSIFSDIVEVCINIEKRFEIKFLEKIGSDTNHVHFLLQSVLMLSVKKRVETIKSITAKELFRQHLEIEQELWIGNLK